MREHKYRAWSPKQKEMIYFTLKDVTSGKVVVLAKDETIFSEYTGLKDKNGKDVYEGDVVIHAEWKVMVRWNEKRASFELIAKDGIVDAKDLSTTQKYIEIIGNIYENPDLATKGIPLEE